MPDLPVDLRTAHREIDSALRATDRGAVPGDEPAGGRVGAGPLDDRHPARRGAGAAAADRDGRRHHRQRRGRQAHGGPRRPGRPQARRVRPRVPQRDRDRHRDRHGRRCAATWRRPT